MKDEKSSNMDLSTHLEDVLAYKEDIARRREAILDQLVADAQEQGGMGYD